jgi:pilus assembly protein CpaF
MAGMDLPVTAIREQIASAVNIIVQQTRFSCGSRKISKITEVTGIEGSTIQLQDIFEYKQRGFSEQGKVDGEFAATGFVPSFYETLKAIGVPVDLSIFRNGRDEFE